MIHFKYYLITIVFTLNLTSVLCQEKINAIDLSSSFEGLDNFSRKTLSENNIFWIGEQHGTQANYIVGLNYLKYLSKTFGIDYILIEAGIFEEHLLNHYLASGDTLIINQLYGVSATFSNVVEDKKYYQSIYNFYKENQQIKKPKFISIDIEHNWGKTLEWIGSTVNTFNSPNLAKIRNKTEKEIFAMDFNAKDIKTMYEEAQKLSATNSSFDSVSYSLNNIMQLFLAYHSGSGWDRVRDSCIYKNFEVRNAFLHFEKYKIFGKWGNYHTWQIPEKTHFVASYIATNNPEIKQHTTELLYLDSKFRFPSEFIPFLLKPFFKGALTQRYALVSANSNRKMFGNVVKNIKVLKKLATSDIMLFDWNSLPKDNVPYRSRPFNNDNSAIDYVILVQNSAPCIPLSNRNTH